MIQRSLYRQNGVGDISGRHRLAGRTSHMLSPLAGHQVDDSVPSASLAVSKRCGTPLSPGLGLAALLSQRISRLVYSSHEDGFHETLVGSCRTRLRVVHVPDGIGLSMVGSRRRHCRLSARVRGPRPRSRSNAFSGRWTWLACQLLATLPGDTLLAALLAAFWLPTRGSTLQDGNPGWIMTPTFTRMRMRIRKLEATVVI